MNIKYIYTATAILLTMISFAQVKDKKLSKGDKLYDQRSYFKSSEVYEKVANDGYKSIELFEKLGDSYFFNAEYAKANKWYAELFQLSSEVDPIYFYRYSQTLKSVGDDKNSDLYLEQFSKLNGSDSRARQYNSNTDYLDKIKDNSKIYTVEDAGINTAFSDYGASFYSDKIVFSSSRKSEDRTNKKDSWTSDYYSSLYSASLSNDGKLSNVKVFAPEIHTQYHESDPVFSKDGKTMFFTRNNEQKIKKGSDKVIFLKIYKATLNNGKWGDIIELPFNSNDYSCAHPALSADDKLLFFASDMPGGFGDSDIYKVAVDGDYNMSGNPSNLGKSINTQGKETFPWVNNNSELYFASDGHLGLGGLDIFVTDIENNNYNSKIINVGKPINSQFDDFYFVELKNLKIGFFTSNREPNNGKDDIYRFEEVKQLENLIKISGIVVDVKSLQAIPGALVTIYDQNHNKIMDTNADNNGRFLTPIDCVKGAIYYIKAESPEYETKEITINSSTIDLEKGITIALSKLKYPIENGDDLAKMLNIQDVLFDLDKSNIRPDAQVELQKIVAVMKDFPELKIAIGSYTDSRQSDQYNLALSEKRAKSTRSYLISKGIEAKRMTAKGYGETKLLNKCSNGVICSEAEHQINRRSEFIIVK